MTIKDSTKKPMLLNPPLQVHGPTGRARSMAENTKSSRRPLASPQKLKLRDVNIVIIEARCKGCSFCIEFCPKDVLERDSKLNVRGIHPPRVKDEQSCVGCGICEEVCPDFAIFLVDKGEKR